MQYNITGIFIFIRVLTQVFKEQNFSPVFIQYQNYNKN